MLLTPAAILGSLDPDFADGAKSMPSTVKPCLINVQQFPKWQPSSTPPEREEKNYTQ